MWDSMRGVVTDYNDKRLSPTESAAEYGGQNAIDLTSTGIRVRDGDGRVNGGSGAKLIYIAIRRPDGYVGKPAEAGTDVFAMDVGNSSATGPAFDSNFVVDFALNREYAGTDNWATTTRLTGRRALYTNSDAAQQSAHAYYYDDFNTGWAISMPSNYQSWMWKRGKGFDVLIQNMTGSSYQFWNHTCMGQAPEMCWMKKLDGSADWEVWHKDLNGGTASYNWSVHLNEYEPEYQPGGGVNYMWGLANPPDASSVVVLDSYFGGSGEYMMLLFSSVTGISKVGSYSGSSSQQTISTGFQPRFVIIRRRNDQQDWVVLDTLRGWVQSTNDPRLELNNTSAGNANTDFGYPTTDGFVLEGNLTKTNENGGDYIYYAHA